MCFPMENRRSDTQQLTAVLHSTVPTAKDPEPIYRLFGRRLRELRELKKVPPGELASFTGLTRSSIANIEKGKQRVMLHQLVLFARCLNVQVTELLPRAEPGAMMSAAEAESQPEKLAYLEQVKLSPQLAQKDASHATAKKKKRKNA